MKLPKTERILVAITELLDDLDTTGNSVQRARVYDWSDKELPAISVHMGTDLPTDGSRPGFTLSDWTLVVDVVAHCKKLEYAYIDTTLNLIRSEVTTALLKDITLGLDFVMNVIEEGADKPAISGDVEKPAGKMEFSFQIKYRRLNDDPRL